MTAASAALERAIPPGLDGAVAQIAKAYGVSPETVHAWAVARWTLALTYAELVQLFHVRSASALVAALERLERGGARQAAS